LHFEDAKALALLGDKIRRHSWKKVEYVAYFGHPIHDFIKFLDYIHFIPYIPTEFDRMAFDWEEFQ
jgi:hypothetical protein